MIELRLKTSEISTFERPFKIIYVRWLKKSVQRNFKASYTGYFFSFSNFKILHRLIKTFVIPILNEVFGTSKCHFLKSDLKNLKNLKIDRLQTKQTIIPPENYKVFQWIRRKVKDTKTSPTFNFRKFL